MWYVCDVCLLFYYCIYWTSSLLIKKFKILNFNYLQETGTMGTAAEHVGYLTPERPSLEILIKNIFVTYL